MYFLSNSTTFTDAVWPTIAFLISISDGVFMSHTAIVRSCVTKLTDMSLIYQSLIDRVYKVHSYY